jgi:hypothetical protein
MQSVLATARIANDALHFPNKAPKKPLLLCPTSVKRQWAGNVAWLFTLRCDEYLSVVDGMLRWRPRTKPAASAQTRRIPWSQGSVNIDVRAELIVGFSNSFTNALAIASRNT